MQTELRPVEIITEFTSAAAGSVLICCGGTRVICTASVEASVPPFRRGSGAGWLTAEYSMLPGATPGRKPRDGVKKDGRGVEIGRLIGRALRCACDLTRMGERTIYIDCDVIQADGGTRTASITGGFVALCLAVDKLMKSGVMTDSPIIRQIAAVSAGIVENEITLDLDYARDSAAQADVNIIMAREISGEMSFVEIQGTGEKRPFTRSELDNLLKLGESGAAELIQKQLAALGDAANVIGKKPRLVVASNNFNKLRELKQILSDEYEIISMREAGFSGDIDENGDTFEQNALIKARAVMNFCGCAALADDSGLCVDALNGRPGVHSARYCGVHDDDEANNRLLMKELEDVPAPRAARYECAIALCRPGKPDIVATGACEGEMLAEYRGTGGFGYDPLFFSHDLNMTFAEASEADKNRISHRARAISALLAKL